MTGRAALWMILAIVAFIAILHAPPSGSQDLAEEIVAAVPANWPPQYLRDPDTGHPTGFAVDFLDEAARLAGLRIRYEMYDSWTKVHQAVMEGHALIIPDLGITAERMDDYDFTTPIETENISIFVRQANSDILGIESLTGRKVGVVEFNKGVHLMKARNESELILFSSAEEAIMALLSGTIDALVYPENPVWMMTRSAGFHHKLKTAGPPLLELKRAIAVRKGNPELLQALDEAVLLLGQSPKYLEIYARWFKAPEPYWTVRRVVGVMGGLLALSVVILVTWRYVSISRMNKSLRASIRERERVEQALRKSRSELRAIFQNVAAGIALLNPEGRYLEINDKWAEMLGYSKGEVIGKTFGEMTFPEDREESLQRLKKLAANNVEGYRIEKRYLRKDGSVFWGDLSVTRILDREGRIEALIAVILDISDAKTTEEQLKKANRELEGFAYTVSHDLRSPLTAIIGFAEFLNSGDRTTFDPQDRECISEIEKSGRRMLSLMEDLLVLAKVGKLECPAEPADTDRIVEGVLAELSKSYDNAEKLIRCSCLPKVRIPETLLSQLFLNLIGNALHYAGGTGKAIEVVGERKGRRVTYTVRDHGPGIPEEERSRIFEVFYRGASGRQTKGTGIGLAIVQKIAQLYGGHAWVEETPGGGSTFLVILRDEEPAPEGKEG